jgi:hypothetical protein
MMASHWKLEALNRESISNRTCRAGAMAAGPWGAKMFSTTPLIRFALLTAVDVITWEDFPQPWPRLSDEVQLWRLALNGADEVQVNELAEALSDDERERAAGFHFPIHQQRYVIGRGLLRSILARYVGETPSSLAFTCSHWGKPHLAGSTALHFNFSHSEDLGLIAVRRAGPVGIDVERLDRREWTRREAVLKATGLGIFGLNREIDACRVQTFVVAPGFVASVALLDPARQAEFAAS